jgi:hypoxanthine phosphoribosyltransferase
LFSEEQIRARVQTIGAQIGEEFKGEELRVIGLMKNCIVFMADLIRAIPLETTSHLVRCHYREGETAQTDIVFEADFSFAGQNVLLVEDVIATGITNSYLVESMRQHEPAKLRVCALLDRKDDRRVEMRPDWTAFELTEVGDGFVVGYGLDYAEHYRGLPYLGTIPRPPAEAGE